MTDLSINSPMATELQRIPLVIGIVAGEASGDNLGANFMAQMNSLRDDIVWVGVGGSKMQAQGLQTLFALERLAVMGLVEVLKHLPDLLKARRELVDAFFDADVDWFIGIDAPDFNLRVAKKLKPEGIFCVQYVSPSIWAWRESRIHSIKAATHLVLCLFPFELDVYERYNHPAICVGHPLVNDTSHGLPQEVANTAPQELRRDLVWQNPDLLEFFARRDKDISHLICFMPGSRRSEIKAILPVMLDSILNLLKNDDKLCFVIPTIDKDHQHIVQMLIDEHIDKNDAALQGAIAVVYDDSQTQANFSQTVMAMSDLIVLASGTATLEAMLLNRPMVVVYQMNALTYAIAKRLVKVPFVALPNILAGERIVPELLQENATAENICNTVESVLKRDNYRAQRKLLSQTATWLRQQSSQTVSSAVSISWYDEVNRQFDSK